MSQPIVVTSAPQDELLTLDEAKRHLRLYSSDLDDEVTSLIRAARDYCERFAARTLRASTTRTIKLEQWWCDQLELPFPPLLGITSIAYYDTNNSSQTLASSNYYAETSTDGGGCVEWTYNATIPSVYSREDAITVTYTAGYADLASVPPVAVQAMKCKVTELWGAGTESETKAAREACDRLLSLVDWTGYA